MSLVRDRKYRRYVKEKVILKRLRTYLLIHHFSIGLWDCYGHNHYDVSDVIHVVGTYMHTRQYSTHTANNNGYRPRWNHKKWNHLYGGNPKKSGFGQRSVERECYRKETKEAMSQW